MAENIVAGLFGLTPEMYGEQQRRSALREGIDLAKLTPGEAGAAMTYAGARGLGGAIAGALGVEDPQLKMISVRQQIMSQLDQSDPESIIKGAQMLAQAGDQQGAMALAQYARQAQGDVAQTQQRRAAAAASMAQAGRERVQADPFQKLVESGKYTPASLAEYQRTGLPADLVLYEKPEKPENLRSGEKREAVSNEMFDNRSFKDLTPKEKAIVNKRLEDEEGTRAEKGAPKTILPGQPVAPKDWMDFTQKVLSSDPIMQRTSTILSDAPSAIEIIRNSRSNDFAAASLPTSIALLTGQGKNMSNADVDRFARTGGLDDRLAQDAVKFFTGRTTEVKKDQAEKFAIALYRGALIERKRKLESAAEEFGYTESPNYKVALRNIDSQLAQFKLVKKGEKPSSPTSSDDALINKYVPSEKK